MRGIAQPRREIGIRAVDHELGGELALVRAVPTAIRAFGVGATIALRATAIARATSHGQPAALVAPVRLTCLVFGQVVEVVARRAVPRRAQVLHAVDDNDMHHRALVQRPFCIKIVQNFVPRSIASMTA